MTRTKKRNSAGILEGRWQASQDMENAQAAVVAGFVVADDEYDYCFLFEEKNEEKVQFLVWLS